MNPEHIAPSSGDRPFGPIAALALALGLLVLIPSLIVCAITVAGIVLMAFG